MKQLLLVLLALYFIPAAQAQSKKAKAKADKVTTANLETHIQYLASDKLEGRRAGSAGEALAMQYISNMFEKYKLMPKLSFMMGYAKITRLLNIVIMSRFRRKVDI